LFADDSNLLYSNKNPKTLESIVNTELDKVYRWLNANKLTMNTKNQMLLSFILIKEI
jgi:beta-lactam-binding protein with PASTA domain